MPACRSFAERYLRVSSQHPSPLKNHIESRDGYPSTPLFIHHQQGELASTHTGSMAFIAGLLDKQIVYM